MDIQKEREAFNKEFGIDDADTFPAFSGGIESSAALKCNWLGWKKRAEFEYRENPETIEIDGLKTIHKLCKFADEHNMKDCSFTEIVERMFDELAKAQAVPDLGELQERIAGHQYYHDEHGHMIVDMDDVVKEISGFDGCKAQAVPEGFVVVSQKDLLELTIAINAVDLATHTESKTNEVREMWQQVALKLMALGISQEPAND